jgi:putative CocE/NonD family hydrolase
MLLLIGLRDLRADAPKPTAKTPIEAAYKVRVERNILIPTRDGTKLAADLIRPDADGKFPVLIEYIPYRKDDVSRGGYGIHHYLAERGFIGVRLDVRGTGASEGVNTDEYMPVEQLDGFDAVEWLAKQPWCNGNVGMFGASYGGFTCIQVAMHRPPHLKAICPMYATDDRYTDDCHYTPGGNMRMYYDVGTYGGSMVAMNALPPAPELTGERWADMWKSRLEKNEPYLLHWLKHQVDGPYWRGASLRPGYDRIACPTFLIAGWRDGYANNMLRTFVNLKCPKKLLVGPWVHSRPHSSIPGPRIDWMYEMARFFAETLRGENHGFFKGPLVEAYMQESHRASRTLDVTPGHWRSEATFPAAGASELTLHLHDGGVLLDKPARKSKNDFDEFENLPTAGLANGFWSAGGMAFYLADDQRWDEAVSLTYTSPPLDEELRLLGWPRVILYGSATAKVATFVAKLADVSPDGSSTLIVDGSLNGTRRRTLTEPEEMKAGEVYELKIPMNPTGWVVKKGHCLRLAISGADFPNLWPTPYRCKQRVYRGGQFASRLLLPVVPASTLPAPTFLPPPSLKDYVKSYGESPKQQMVLDQITGAATVVNRTASKTILENNYGTLLSEHNFRCTANARDPAQAAIVGHHRFALKREDGDYDIVAESTLRATATAFHLTINLTVTRNGKLFFQKSWLKTETRKLL